MLSARTSMITRFARMVTPLGMCGPRAWLRRTSSESALDAVDTQSGNRNAPIPRTPPMTDRTQDQGASAEAERAASPSDLSPSGSSQSSIPSAGWRDMDDAPRDGTIIVVRYHPWNDKRNAPQVQMAQWSSWTGCGEWRPPFDLNSSVYADGWMTIEELNAQGTSASGQDGNRLGAQPAGPVRQDAPTPCLTPPSTDTSGEPA